MEIRKIDYEKYKELLNKFDVILASSDYIEFARAYWGAKSEFLGFFSGDKLQAILTLFSRQENNLNILEGAIKSYTEIIYLEDFQVDFNEIVRFIKNNFKFDILELSICPIVNSKKIEISHASQNTAAYVLDVGEIRNADELLVLKVIQKTRQQIRKSYKYQVGGEISVDIEKFYPIYFNTMQRLNAKPKDREYFTALKDSFCENFYILFAKKDNKAVAANLFVIKNNYLLMLFSASLTDYWKYYVNDFIYWEPIKFGIEKGVRWFDFGVNSNRDAEKIRFKRGFGARAFPVEHLVILNSAKAFLNVYWKKFRFLIKLMFKI